MKKTLFAVLALTFISSLCFAQEASAPATNSTLASVETKTFAGKVDSVTIGDATEGTRSELVVLADNGNKLTFVVKSDTPITDKDAKTVALSDIKQDNNVTIEYTMGRKGLHKAQSIKLVE